MDGHRVVEIVNAAVPNYAFAARHEWTWTRPSGVWKLNLTFGDDPHLTARLERNASQGRPPMVVVPLTPRGINAAVRWLVLVDAVDRHPDDAQRSAAEKS